ncbi:hypothetical protein EPUS_01879 [Endocarpon pusillum Z07020]|uniref:Uncharacterized protein n=1 Tax=Endocarpon pusillum (strain Z07020 / HMAS-L-300199) TaxID=1263415 RepID=U1HKR5_ENDPU|nr:uncharacterized protein EPUS_01879 [Endocarpon pusillum Z07020]ERF69549.1 hypothetical protein EPUS_01879 [Endocarpon pusillum Z07020]
MLNPQHTNNRSPSLDHPVHDLRDGSSIGSATERRSILNAGVSAPGLTPRSEAARSRGASPSDRQKSREYVQSIIAHSRRYTANSLYPGQNYLGLAAWLQEETHEKSILNDRHKVAVLHCLTADGPTQIQHYAHQDLERFSTQMRSENKINKILFLRGYASPDWISMIGGICRIDPEYFNRHLAFMTTFVYRNTFSKPSLSSTCRNIITLRINTILDGYSQRDAFKNLAARRISEAADLNTYSRLYQRTASYGDSIVKGFYTLDEQYSILEQEISVCVRESKQGWLALVWLDVGRDLTLGPKGPWLSHHVLSGSANSLPVIQHHVSMVTKQTYTERANTSIDSFGISTLSDSAIQQSTMLLPFDFNSLADSETAKQDVFYALNTVFQHAAFSHVQLINLMEYQIDKEMGILARERDRSHSLDNLQYFRSILDRYVRQIRDVICATKSQGRGGWPSASDTKGQSKCSLTVDRLLEDYDGLLLRALGLCERCTEGMGIMMNRAVVAESKKAIDQAERLKKLTLLASFFIPLSFITSLFGANFSEFAPGNYLSIWSFFAASVPVLLLTYCFYLWDVGAWFVWLRELARVRVRR